MRGHWADYLRSYDSSGLPHPMRAMRELQTAYITAEEVTNGGRRSRYLHMSCNRSLAAQ